MKDKNGYEPSDYITGVSNSLYTFEYGKGTWDIANKDYVELNCEKIVLTQKGLDIKINLNDNLENIETITINGFKFKKEKHCERELKQFKEEINFKRDILDELKKKITLTMKMVFLKSKLKYRLN